MQTDNKETWPEFRKINKNEPNNVFFTIELKWPRRHLVELPVKPRGCNADWRPGIWLFSGCQQKETAFYANQNNHHANYTCKGNGPCSFCHEKYLEEKKYAFGFVPVDDVAKWGENSLGLFFTENPTASGKRGKRRATYADISMRISAWARVNNNRKTALGMAPRAKYKRKL